jgi:hypothetical protein
MLIYIRPWESNVNHIPTPEINVKQMYNLPAFSSIRVLFLSNSQNYYEHGWTQRLLHECLKKNNLNFCALVNFKNFDNAVECDSNIYLHECSYMFGSTYDRLQKAQQHVEETTIT